MSGVAVGLASSSPGIAKMAVENSFEYFYSDLQSKHFATFEEMGNKREQPDVTIRCGNKSLSAHRLVLSSAIPYFRELFANDASQTKMHVVTMRQMDPATLECLIDYAYTRQVKITEANVESLLLASEFLQITEVRDICCHLLSEHLSPSNVIRTQKFAKNLKMRNLAKSVDRYLKTYFDAVCRTNEFLRAPFSFINGLARRDDIRKDKVFEAVKKWMEADSERTRYLPKLPIGVQLSLISGHFTTEVSQEELNKSYVSPWYKAVVDFRGQNELASNSKATGVRAGFLRGSPASRFFKLKKLKNVTRYDCVDAGVSDESDVMKDDADERKGKRRKPIRYSQRWRNYGRNHRKSTFRNTKDFKRKFIDWNIDYDDLDADYDDWDTNYDDWN